MFLFISELRRVFIYSSVSKWKSWSVWSRGSLGSQPAVADDLRVTQSSVRVLWVRGPGKGSPCMFTGWRKASLTGASRRPCPLVSQMLGKGQEGRSSTGGLLRGEDCLPAGGGSHPPRKNILVYFVVYILCLLVGVGYARGLMLS